MICSAAIILLGYLAGLLNALPLNREKRQWVSNENNYGYYGANNGWFGDNNGRAGHGVFSYE